ncbi:MAG: hypothetical protein ISR83_07630 [Candidatus Marinimicrobia bacterium]|nr:hypothetical protein [Candidatus Neomarinimicrobiota bacterium]
MKRYLIQLFLPFLLFGQGNLLDELHQPEPLTIPVKNIFKGTRVVNLQSVEMVHPNILQFMVSHRFGTINDGFYTLFGLDEAEVRFDFQYGYNNKIVFGTGRNSFKKTYETFIKMKLKDQTDGLNNFPFAIVYYSSIFINTEESGPTVDEYFENRLSYVHQLIIGKKISTKLSIEVVPTFLHRNFVLQLSDSNDTYAIGVGTQLKINQWVTFNSEYCFRIGEYSDLYNNSFSLGFDLETGGHVFQIHLTNSQGMFERAFISETSGNWNTGDIYFGFNLSRPFQMK